MTKHTDTSRSTDSGVSGNAQTEAKEIRREDALAWYGEYRKRLGIKSGHDIADRFQMLADFANEVKR